MFEGNAAPLSGFMMAGKPIVMADKPILMADKPRWSHSIESADGCVKSMCVLREGSPYSTFHAKGFCAKGGEVDGANAVRAVMKWLFELAAGVSDDLEACEIAGFLSMIHEAARDLRRLLSDGT